MKKVLLSILVMLITLLEASQGGESGGMYLWWLLVVALIGIGVTVVYARFKIKKLEAMLEKQIRMEQNQNGILTNMSENIHNIAQRTLSESHQMIQSSSHTEEKKHELMQHVEEKLLNVTNDLIDYLRLKSKKVEIKNNQFNLNNVLNEISGTVCTTHAGKDAELIFEVNKSVPRFMIGDSLHLGQVLNGVFDHSLSRLGENDELKVEVSMFSNYEDNIQLEFKFIDTGNGFTHEELEDLFSPYYDEKSGNYIGLGIFVSKALSELMGGKLNIQSVPGKGTTYILELPFKVPDPDNKRKYRLPSKVLTEKNVIIVDNNYNSALAIKKMFAYFRHDVRVVSKEEFELGIPNMSACDIVVINESLFNGRLVRYLSELKDKKEVKVIALNNLLKVNAYRFEDEVIDVHIYKPLNQERVFELIIELYEIKVPQFINKESEGSIPKAKVHRGDLKETKNVNQESFAVFSGKNLLIVDDNKINLNVLVSVLGKSNMNITLASDGEQAVEMVKSRKIDFDLILMDINMPVMDGYTATKMIRKESNFDNIPIVAFTALVLDSEKRKMFNSGINAYLSKPLNIGKLHTAFAMYLSEKAIQEVRKEKENMELSKSFEGLDIVQGLAHANQNEALYVELLKEFDEAYGKSGEIFDKLIQEKRFEQMKMLCVDLKGLTGTIGAIEMQRLVNEIYQHLIYKKYDLTKNYIEKYNAELQIVSESIKAYVFSLEMYED